MAFLVVLVVFLFALAAVRYVTAMPGRSHPETVEALTLEGRRVRDRLAEHVRVLAEEIGERHLWRLDALDRAADYIEASLSRAGLEVETQEFAVNGNRVRNSAVEIQGRIAPRQIVIVGAHYDSVSGCPGANDNGSGVAALIELAGIWASRQPGRTLRFVAFVNEEPPFCFSRAMGSWVYARRCRERRERVVAMLALETIGYYSDEPGSQRYPFPFGLLYPRTGDFIGFVANLSSRRLVKRCIGAFRRHASVPSQGTAAPGYLPGVFWSDHWSFWREGYRAVMVTDTAPFRYPYYHTPGDTPEKLDVDRMARVVLGLEAVIGVLVTPSLPPGRGVGSRKGRTG